MKSHSFSYPEKYLIHGSLFYDMNKEEGQVRLLPNLPKDVVGLDILQDWIADLQDEYDKLRKEVFSRERNK